MECVSVKGIGEEENRSSNRSRAHFFSSSSFKKISLKPSGFIISWFNLACVFF